MKPAPIDDFLATLRRLRIDRSKGRRETLQAASSRRRRLRTPDIALDGGLVSAFRQLLTLLYPKWQLGRSPDYPFRHLETDGVWRLVAKEGVGYRPDEKEWWVIELKHGRPADAVVGQVSRHLGWVSEECARRGESAMGAIVARDADERLRYAVRANPRLTLWTWDDDLRVSRVEGEA